MVLFPLLKLEGRLSSSHLRVKSSFTHSYCITDDCPRVVESLHDWLSMTGQQRNSWCNVLCEGRRTKVVLCLELLIVPWEMQKCCRSTHRLLLFVSALISLCPLLTRLFAETHLHWNSNIRRYKNTTTLVLTPSLNVVLPPCYSLVWCEN
jgi:hypothetical protein